MREHGRVAEDAEKAMKWIRRIVSVGLIGVLTATMAVVVLGVIVMAYWLRRG